MTTILLSILCVCIYFLLGLLNTQYIEEYELDGEFTYAEFVCATIIWPFVVIVELPRLFLWISKLFFTYIIKCPYSMFKKIFFKRKNGYLKFKFC